MTVRELREVLNRANPEEVVKICVNTPGGWICPDGCAVDIKAVYHGIDFHTQEILLVPLHKLDIHDVEEWGKPVQEEKSEPKKDVFMNGMTVEEYVRKIEEAHELSKGSQMRFK